MIVRFYYIRIQGSDIDWEDGKKNLIDDFKSIIDSIQTDHSPTIVIIRGVGKECDRTTYFEQKFVDDIDQHIEFKGNMFKKSTQVYLIKSQPGMKMVIRDVKTWHYQLRILTSKMTFEVELGWDGRELDLNHKYPTLSMNSSTKGTKLHPTQIANDVFINKSLEENLGFTQDSRKVRGKLSYADVFINLSSFFVSLEGNETKITSDPLILFPRRTGADVRLNPTKNFKTCIQYIEKFFNRQLTTKQLIQKIQKKTNKLRMPYSLYDASMRFLVLNFLKSKRIKKDGQLRLELYQAVRNAYPGIRFTLSSRNDQFKSKQSF